MLFIVRDLEHVTVRNCRSRAFAAHELLHTFTSSPPPSVTTRSCSTGVRYYDSAPAHKTLWSKDGKSTPLLHKRKHAARDDRTYSSRYCFIEPSLTPIGNRLHTCRLCVPACVQVWILGFQPVQWSRHMHTTYAHYHVVAAPHIPQRKRAGMFTYVHAPFWRWSSRLLTLFKSFLLRHTPWCMQPDALFVLQEHLCSCMHVHTAHAAHNFFFVIRCSITWG